MYNILTCHDPGIQYEPQPIAHFFTALLFTSSAPLWFALVDQGARLAARQPPALGADGSTLASITSWMVSGMWLASITALGMLLIPVVTGLLYFVAFRALGNIWRGSF